VSRGGKLFRFERKLFEQSWGGLPKGEQGRRGDGVLRVAAKEIVQKEGLTAEQQVNLNHRKGGVTQAPRPEETVLTGCGRRPALQKKRCWKSFRYFCPIGCPKRCRRCKQLKRIKRFGGPLR